MTRFSGGERRFEDEEAAGSKEAERLREFNRKRFGADIRRFGKAPPTPPPLPPKKPTAFEPPTKYEERNG